MTDANDDDRIGSGLFGQSPPDVTPLLDLLRSDRPISAGLRDMLAQMIDPTLPGYLYLRFELEDTEGKVRNAGRDLQNLKIAAFHGRLVASGKSANQAAIEAGQEFGLDQRRVYARLAEHKRAIGWIRGNTDK